MSSDRSGVCTGNRGLVFSPTQTSTRGGDSSVVRTPDSWSKSRVFESLQERQENFLL